MTSFTKADYQIIFDFAREQYFLHESTGRGFDIKAAIVMEMVEGVIGQQSDFPQEARERLNEMAAKSRRKLYNANKSRAKISTL